MIGTRHSGTEGGAHATGWHGAAELAEQQHGVVSRDQLRRLGMTEAVIDHAIVTARLLPIFRGAFGLGHRAVGREGRLMAATLAAGEGALISHGTAAALLGIWENYPARIEVLAPVDAGRKLPGLRRRYTPLPPPRHRWAVGVIPCTSPSHTIVDVAGTVHHEEPLRATIEQAAVNGMLNVVEVDEILATAPRRVGAPLLRLILDDWRRYPPKVKLRSRMEAKLLPLLTQYALPIPRCNEKLIIRGEKYEVDFLWPRQRLAVETDGGRYHDDNPEAERRDDRRDRVLPGAGYRVWRLRWDDLDKHPVRTMAELRRRLELA